MTLSIFYYGDNMTFSDKLKHLRKESKMTLLELSKAINISERTIRRYEKAEIEPTLSVLIALASHFQVPIDYLCGISSISDFSLAEQLNLSDKAVENLVAKVLHRSSDTALDIAAYHKAVDLILSSEKFIKFACLLANYADISDPNDEERIVGVEKLIANIDHMTLDTKIDLAELKLYRQGQALIEDVNRAWHSSLPIEAAPE